MLHRGGVRSNDSLRKVGNEGNCADRGSSAGESGKYNGGCDYLNLPAKENSH